jgi:guanylate kinase
MSREDFESRREHGDFFEWEENHGNLYGTLRSNIVDGISSGTDLLFQIDIRGALNFKKHFPDNAVTIFIIPPSFEVLNQRLLARGTVDPDELTTRFTTARSEYAALLALRADPGKVDYVVVNHDLDGAYDKIRSIVLSEQARYGRMDISSVAALCEVGEGGK